MKTYNYVFLLSVLIIGFPLMSNAQMIKKGSLVGNVSFQFKQSTTTSHHYNLNYNLTEEFHVTELNMDPSVSYYVLNNLGVGGTVTVGYGRTSDEDGYTLTTLGTFFGPIVRYYFSKGFFVNGKVTFGYSESLFESNGNPDVRNAYHETSGEFGIGHSFKLSESVLFDLLPVYQHTKQESTDGYEYIDKTNSFGLRMGLTIILRSKN